MTQYKPPESELVFKDEREFSPVSGLFIGLFISIIVCGVVSGISTIVFSIWSGIDLTDANAEQQLAESVLLLLVDLVITAVMLYLAGRAVGKRTPQKEVIFGILLAVLSALIYGAIYMMTVSYDMYPSWYNYVTFIVVILFPVIGAKSMELDV